jgi:serine/threonine-protein kinase
MWWVPIIAIVAVFGTPVLIVRQVLSYRERTARLRLEAGSGGGSGKEVKRLEEENRLLRERVENLESIVVGVDYELNQKLLRLAADSKLLAAGPTPPPPSSESPSPPPPSSPSKDLGRTATAVLPPQPARVSTNDELTIGDVLAGRYTIKRLLGRGGMGAIYLATDDVLGEPVALKVIAAGASPWDPTMIERFRREAAAARKIASPNVIRLHDIGEARPGLLYLSMEYFDGRTLADVIAQRGVVSIAKCRDYLDQICAGLIAAHDAGVVHRDLKPQNVMVGERDAVKIIDFGLAKARVEDGLTATGALLGTPLYMAPEQIRGKVIDARTDIYALGALAFHLLTGRPPLTGDNAIAIGFAHLTETPPRAKSIRPDIPDAWDEVIAKALEKSPDDRPSSARAFRDQIDSRR